MLSLAMPNREKEAGHEYKWAIPIFNCTPRADDKNLPRGSVRAIKWVLRRDSNGLDC